MKAFFFIIFLLFSTLNLSAIVLNEDTFDGFSNDGWDRDDGGSDVLRLNQYKNSEKSFDFGTTYANAEITITFKATPLDIWEWWDRMFIDIDGSSTTYYPRSTITETITTNLDSSGKIKLEFSTNTNNSEEKLDIDYVRIESTAVIPTITPETFVIYNEAPTGTLVGTISSSGSPNAFTILSGDTDNIFAVNNSGSLLSKFS